MRSIERHLTWWILGAAALGAALLGGVAYRVILFDLNTTLDENLQAVALAVADHRSATASGAPDPAARAGADGAEIVVVEWTPQGQMTFSSDTRVALRFRDQAGLERQRLQGTDWDTYTVVRTGHVVQAAQRAQFQQEEAAEAAASLFLPFALVFGVAAVLLILALRRGLAPLDRTAAEVAARSANSLAPIDTTHLPREIAPLVLALNGPMQRQPESLQVASASWRMRRTSCARRSRPALQLQPLQGAADDASRQTEVRALRAGIDRAQHLVEQLPICRAPNRVHGPSPFADLLAPLAHPRHPLQRQGREPRHRPGARIESPGALTGDASDCASARRPGRRRASFHAARRRGRCGRRRCGRLHRVARHRRRSRHSRRGAQSGVRALPSRARRSAGAAGESGRAWDWPSSRPSRRLMAHR